MINYNGKKFRNTEAGPDGTAPVATYHQDGDLVWAEASGGDVRRCMLVGVCDPDGTIRMGYTMQLASGETAIGRCVSTPRTLDDGRILLHEEWERYQPRPASGVSAIEETE
ncbi:hypothetical protein [Streptomyces sp. NPDC093707]|uniref:hypothetical protein n=1 Tax=Streptomyces sp. NPDC093707 TaxID=3154984 RepID=UPI00344B7BE6